MESAQSFLQDRTKIVKLKWNLKEIWDIFCRNTKPYNNPQYHNACIDKNHFYIIGVFFNKYYQNYLWKKEIFYSRVIMLILIIYNFKMSLDS